MRKTTAKAHLRAPLTLSPESRAWWRTLVSEYTIDDDAGLLILRTAMESLDRLRGAQAILRAEGICVKDRFGQPRQHPATMVERDAKTALLRSLKALNLDIQPPGPVGRPPAMVNQVERRAERKDRLCRV
jgi:P27 family predicted phage terminase small subunit